MVPAPKKLCFYDFCVNTAEKALFIGDASVALTPKAYDLLYALASNPNRLITKAELLDMVWPDSFVEEGNLTFTVNQIRKALGDNSRDPKYIETVPRRGYRFIAPVTEGEAAAEKPKLPPAGEIVPETLPEREIRAHRAPWRTHFSLLTAAVVVIFVLVGSFFLFGRAYGDDTPPILTEQYSVQRLSNNGGSFHSVISPDGTKVAMTMNIGKRMAIWMYDLTNSNYIEVVPAAEVAYGGLLFSENGENLYFARRAENNPFDVFRISIFGGTPFKVAAATQGWISVSPDERQLAFVRCPYEKELYCAVYTVNAADGSDEKMLYSRPALERISAVRFTPNGRRLLFASGQSRNASNQFRIYAVELDSGKVTPASNESFFNVTSIDCFRRSEKCLFVSRKPQDLYFSIWDLNADGTTSKVSYNTENFSHISLDSFGRSAVAGTITDNFRIVSRSFAPKGETTETEVTSARAASFTPDGRVLYASSIGTNNDIWIMNSIGGPTRQITTSTYNEHFPQMGADGRSIIYTSNESGEEQIWRMNVDGTDAVQLTKQNGGRRPFVPADSEWIYYLGSPETRVWRINSRTGAEENVWNGSTNCFAVSPDGSRVAVAKLIDGVEYIVLLEPGSEIERARFELPFRSSAVFEQYWSKRRNSLIYAIADKITDSNSIWEQKLSGGAPVRLADTGQEEVSQISESPDGSTWLTVQGRWQRDAVLLRGLNAPAVAKK